MDKIRQFLKGKKTYLIAAGSILATVVAWATGDMELPEAVKLIVAAVLAVTVRAGVGNGAAQSG